MKVEQEVDIVAAYGEALKVIPFGKRRLPRPRFVD